MTNRDEPGTPNHSQSAAGGGASNAPPQIENPYAPPQTASDLRSAAFSPDPQLAAMCEEFEKKLEFNP